MRIIYATIFLVCLVCTANAQVVAIYQEDFSSYAAGETSGNGWSSSATDCDGTAASRFGVFGGRFEWRDMEGTCACGIGGQADNVWELSDIPISGCNVSVSITIGGSGALENDGITSPTFGCNNSHDQMIVEYSLNGGAYTLFPNGYISGANNLGAKTLSGINANSISIRVTGGNKAVDETYFIDNVRITGNSTATVAITGPTSVCDGGSINLSATAGFADYLWSTGESGQSIVVTTPGTYQVTATSAGGCTAIGTRNVTLAPAPAATIGGATQVCSGGSASINVVQNFASYQWSNGASGKTINISEPDVYTVTVTAANGCIATASRTINPAPLPNANISGPAAVCTGSNISLTASGGTTYRWSTNATAATISVNRGGTYTVTVTNAGGCRNETSVDIDESPRPSVNNPGLQNACGAFTLPAITGTNLTGSEAFYSASNGGGQRFDPGDQITDTRTIFVYDAVTGIAGCTSQQSFIVSVTPKPDITPVANQNACDRYVLPVITGTTLTTGAAYYTGVNGTGTKFNPSDTITTNRTLYAFDGTATCNDQESFSVIIVPGPRVNDLRDTSICAGFTLPDITGTNLSANRAYYTGTNGTGTRFNPGQTITTTQTLFIYDGNATCSSEQTVSINITAGPQINPIRDTASCLNFTLPAIAGNNLTANAAYFTGPGGTGTRLNPGQIINTSQTLYAYDIQGACSDEDTFNITIATTPTVADLADLSRCDSYILPAITGTNLSGSQAYYTQTNGAGTRYRAGDTITTTATLFIYDGAIGCNDEESVTITILQAPRITPIADTSACANVVLTAIQGSNLSANAAYFTQTNGAGTRFAVGDTIKTNTTLFIYDTNGTCSNQDTLNINILQAPILNVINDLNACVRFTLPVIVGTNLSANAAYFTQPNGAGTRLVAGDTITTTTSLYAFDNNGACAAEEPFQVRINANPNANIRPTAAKCNGARDGELEVTVTGKAPFTFNWNLDLIDGQQNVTGVGAGNYSVTITDSIGCLTSTAATITEPAVVDVQCAQLAPVSMTGASDGRAQVIIAGGTAPYNVVWTGATPGNQTLAVADTLVLTNLRSGSYEVRVTDANGCPMTCNFAINILGCNIGIALSPTDATCPSSTDGGIQTTITGALLPLTYNWNIDSLDGREDLTGIAPGNYVLNATDANNCIVTGSVTVGSQFPAPAANITYSSIICEEECFNFSIALSGTPPYELDYQLKTNVGDIFRKLTITGNRDTLEICPATLNTDSGSVVILFTQLKDARCVTNLTLTDTLLVRPIARDTIQQTLCSNDSLVVNGKVYNLARPSGTERIPAGSANSCDSLVFVNLTFLPPITSDLNQTICETDSIVVNGTVYNQTNPSGTETLIGAAANGCDSTVNMNLQFFPPAVFDLTLFICENDSALINGKTYNRANPTGTETFLGASVNGCDSTINISLQFFPIAAFSLNPTLCENDSVVVNGTVYNQSNPTGTEILSAASEFGCDSIVTIALQFFPRDTNVLNQSICENDSLVVNGTVYNQANPSGTETLIGASASGCDSVVNINLQFFPPATDTLNQTICENDSLVVNGRAYNQANPRGTETLIGASANGCDSVVTINLQFFSPATDTLSQTICETDSIVVNGLVYNQANPGGTVRFIGASANGCDSILTIALQFFPTAVFNLDSTLCEGDSLVVNGNVYNQSAPVGTEVLRGVATNGCDSTIRINLTYLPAARTNLDTTLCPGDSIVINGNIYNTSNRTGEEIIAGGAANGCDSIIQIRVQFFAVAVSNLTQRICETDSIVVNGTVYNQANPTGTETLAGASANGCDSIVNINLLFFPPVTFTLNQTICESDSILVNGTVYNQANPTGTETFLGATANGCDSIVIINLQFFPAVTLDLNQTICETDSIVANGKVYNRANSRGTETLRGATASGCDSTININLMFFPTATATLNQTLCAGDSLVINGNVYNQAKPSGTEILRGATTTGCDSTLTINLTFLQAVQRNLDTLLCPGESLFINGVTYNETKPTGTEILRGAAANGCDSIVQVNVRFRPAVSGSIVGDATVCAGDSATLTFRLSGAPTFDIRYTSGINNSVTLNGIVDGHTVQVSPSATTTYAITFIAVNGSACPAQIGSGARVQVSNLSANAVVTTNFAGFGVSCAGATDGTLRAEGSNGIPPLSYRWSTGATGGQLQNTGAGTYNVTITDAAGCPAIDSVTVTAPAAIVINSSTKSPTCAKDKTGSINLDSISGGAAPFEVSLNGTSYRAVNSFPYQLGNLAAGNYNVFVRDANDCEIQFAANIVAPSEPKLDLGPDITVALGDSAVLEGLVNFVPTKIEWRPDTFLTTPSNLRTFVKPMITTTYTLSVSDTSGCKASDQITVFLNRERDVYVPTAFSPDGDGVNDVFYVNGGNDVKEIRKLIIFDRWGNLMYQRGKFQPTDPQFGWDGKFNGNEVNIGVYVYYLEIEFIDGFVEIFEGDITVVR